MKFEFGNISLVAKRLKPEVVRPSSCSNSRRKPSGQGARAQSMVERERSGSRDILRRESNGY